MPTEDLIDQSFETILPQEEAKKTEKTVTVGKWKIKNKTIFLLAGTFLPVFFFLILLIARRPKPAPPPPAPPAPTPTPTIYEEIISSPSAYASDSAIIRIEGELNLIEEKLQSTDLNEVSLNPPLLDMSVDFEE